MRYKLPGHERKTVKTCALETQVLLGNVKVKKPRKVETQPRAKYHRDEDALRTNIIKELRKVGSVVFRLEPSTRGVWGVSDLLVFTSKGDMFFMEVKTILGYLTADQQRFKSLCFTCGANYIVVTDVKQALEVIK